MRPPSWQPTPEIIAAANVTELAIELGLAGYDALHAWSVAHRDEFWRRTIERLGIPLHTPPASIMSDDPRDPRWLDGASLNIAESAFTADPERTAVIHRRAGENLAVPYGELRRLVDSFANGFAAAGLEPGDRVAIAMPMTLEAVVAYLGTVLAGGVVVGIADSFAAEEIATRLRIARCDTVVTSGVLERAGRTLPMYDKVVAAGARRAIVVDPGDREMRAADTRWDEFVVDDGSFDAVRAHPYDPTNILFSSGTTGDPKAIPWTHLTPIKAAADGLYHQDIRPGDVVAWPTSLGWMMGPWLIYASLVNGATMALYDDVPTGRAFLEFVADTGISILGVVPSLVAAWRAADATTGLDLGRLRVVSSTGEAANEDDMAWLMETVAAPVIEYCGGTEIGGGYISSTIVVPAVAGCFTTPCLGLDIRVVDEDPDSGGELFIVPPSIGLSESLLNRDHDEVYHSDLPESDVPLRRHGDQMLRLPGELFRAMGRVDDTMNLGGIKVSSAEIERVVGDVTGVAEVAAVAVPPPGGGPEQLVVYVVPVGGEPDTEALRTEMQGMIRAHLNPLFKIARVVPIAELPRTASAKVMRRTLRTIAR